MKSCYKPTNEQQYLGYLVEECGEVMSAVGKSQRWGLESFNPEIPEDDAEKIFEWILRELKDLRRAIKFVEFHLKDNYR